ncbi:hypothetical protein F383_30230 [Gossypium arboreum]|uniref:Uncharacterized protein n=1 Tax=Gossypium arboreum TaxID=29729 RepID=A0A0B0PEY5_GOSAR|nr:hypothetical protein F383_30230 [Gossypium arboreum]
MIFGINLDLRFAGYVQEIYPSLKFRRLCASGWTRVLNLAGLTSVIRVRL